MHLLPPLSSCLGWAVPDVALKASGEVVEKGLKCSQCLGEPGAPSFQPSTSLSHCHIL